MKWQTKRKIRHLAPPAILLCVFLVMAINNVVSADTLTLHVSSQHLTTSDYDYNFNELNLGLGYGWNIADTDNYRAIAGIYKNSSGKVTTYTGGEVYKRFDNSFITEIGLQAGVVTGYDIPVPLAAAPYLRVADVMKVTVLPLVINDGSRIYLDGVVYGFSLTLGK